MDLGSPAAAGDAAMDALALVGDRSIPSPALHCCCGKVDCVLLKENCDVLESVEKDVHTAAKLGQVRGSFYFPIPLFLLSPSAVAQFLALRFHPAIAFFAWNSPHSCFSFFSLFFFFFFVIHHGFSVTDLRSSGSSCAS
jgi:hypothetical protein